MNISQLVETKKDLDIAKERLKTLIKMDESLQVQIGTQRSIISYIEKQYEKIKRNLMELDGIELDLFKEIAFTDKSVSKAVNTIAERYSKDVSTIWRIYSKSIKERVKTIKKG